MAQRSLLYPRFAEPLGISASARKIRVGPGMALGSLHNQASTIGAEDRRSMHVSPAERYIDREEIGKLLETVPLFAAATEGSHCFTGASLTEAPAGTTVIVQGEREPSFYIVLEGQLRVTRTESDGGTNLLFYVEAGETYGEGAITFGFSEEPGNLEAVTDSRLLRMPADAFWRLLADFPTVRREVVAVMARRFEVYQTIIVHRQSLLSIGTLSAGLMHELNNPGAAALRAVAQMRENLTRLQTVCLRLSRERLTDAQMECSSTLQEQAQAAVLRPFPSGIDQADAEQALATWIEDVGVGDGWRLAPTFTGVGWDKTSIECAIDAFPSPSRSDLLHFVEAMISSFQVLGTMEESLRRVTSLVAAVKKYAHDDEDEEQVVDIHESLHSAVTIVSHKLRPRNVTIHEDFNPGLSKIKTRGRGLIQAWANLFENAIEASPDGGAITARTWAEGSLVCVGIADQGPGIPPEKRSGIFQPFFTTKPFGSGPGLGLHMVHRIVVEQCGGQVSFASRPGTTEFIVRLPIARR